MKRHIVLFCALWCLVATAAHSVGEGSWEKLWGTNVRVTNLPSLEACMESAITTSCILGRGVYDQGATTLDIAVDTTLGSKAFVCELGTQIVGTASPVVKLTGSGGADYGYVQDCTFLATDTIALELYGDVGQWEIRNVRTYSSPPLLGRDGGTLDHAGDSCDVSGFEDSQNDISGVDSNDVVWFYDGTTGKDILTGAELPQPDATTFLFDPNLEILPSVCTSGDLAYIIFDDFGSFHASNIGHITIRDSTFEGKAYIDAGANGRVIISDSFIARTDSSQGAPCLSIYAGYLHLKNLHTTLDEACEGGMSINVHQSKNAQITGGWYSGPLRIGGLYAGNNVFISGANFPNASATEPAIHIYDAARVTGDITVGGTMTTGSFDLITADTDGTIERVDLTVNGAYDVDTWVAADILGAQGTLMPTGYPLEGCIKTSNAEFSISAGVVTRQTCDDDLNLVTSGEVHGIPGTVAHTDNDSITTAQVRGTVHTNTGAGAAKVWSLPAVFEGANFCAYLTAGQDVDLHPAAGDVIYHPLLAATANDCISSDATAHSFVCGFGLDGTTWAVTSYQGTWALVADGAGTCPGGH